MKHALELPPALLEAPARFDARPYPVRPPHRPLWRIGTIVLILGKCRARKASLKQLHVLSWAMRSPPTATFLVSALNDHQDALPGIPSVRFEPSLNRALDFAVAEGLVTIANGMFVLTAIGEHFLNEIDQNDDILAAEKGMLKRLRGTVSQAAVNRLLKSAAS